MRIESPVGMEQRSPNPSRPPRQTPPSHSRKNKRRSGRRSNPPDPVLDNTWPNVAPPNNPDGGLVAGVEYPPRMLWQPTDVQPQNVPSNGQRLFTAMSDPSVCGYSPMPMTYAMQPVSLPTMYRMYQPMPVPNIRTVHSRQRHHCNKHLTNARLNSNVNGYEGLRENGVVEPAVHIALQNGDYASLPPTANKDSVNGDELNSEHRRYSDPGLGPAGSSARSDSDDSESVESGSSITTISRSNKLVLSLIEQMTELKKCNSQLFKELSETKSNLENVKGKLAQCKHSSPADYQPGMLSELIREIRDANRNCEEGLVTKVKSMLEERCNQQAKEVNELKNQLTKLMKEKEESDQRVAKLEEEMTALKLSATNEGREIAVFEEENLALRRELQEARASRTLAENHAAKLEKLVEILRKKVNGSTATETVNRICDVLTSGVCPIPEGQAKEPMNQVPSSSSSSEDERNVAEDGDDNTDDEKLDTSRSDKNSSIASDSKIILVIDSSVNLSGPVTDL